MSLEEKTTTGKKTRTKYSNLMGQDLQFNGTK